MQIKIKKIQSKIDSSSHQKKKINSKKINQKGFTLIELILVIVILGILAAVAAPQFFDMTDDARQAQRDSVVSTIGSAVNMTRSDNLMNGVVPAIPAQLDAHPDGSACADATPCFDGVLQGGIVDNSWNKVDATNYTHDMQDGNPARTYTLDVATGTFLCTANCN